MADEADRTQDRMEREEELIKKFSAKPLGPKPNGFCHWCEATVAETKSFCDHYCRDDWEREQRLLKLKGITK